jgi:hypothetical protein
MTPYVIRQGDHLPLLAVRRRFDLNEVWNHPKNAGLKTLRKSPNILAPGDVVYLPDPAPVTWLPVTVGSPNSFTATVLTTKVSVTFAVAGKALAGVACVVHGLPAPNTFTTDGAGNLSLEVPLATESVVVEFPSVPLVRRLKMGHLDPASECSGVIQRLRALGYISPRSAVDADSPGLATAVTAFQKDNGLPPTGSLDRPTEEALERAHGC